MAWTQSALRSLPTNKYNVAGLYIIKYKIFKLYIKSIRSFYNRPIDNIFKTIKMIYWRSCSIVSKVFLRGCGSRLHLFSSEKNPILATFNLSFDHEATKPRKTYFLRPLIDYISTKTDRNFNNVIFCLDTSFSFASTSYSMPVEMERALNISSLSTPGRVSFDLELYLCILSNWDELINPWESFELLSSPSMFLIFNQA